MPDYEVRAMHNLRRHQKLKEVKSNVCLIGTFLLAIGFGVMGLGLLWTVGKLLTNQ